MSKVDLDSSAVQSYLEILQGIIGRMATNSAACKSWCIALVSAIVVVVAEQANSKYVWVSVVPICLFYLLDSYYLGLERAFRATYNGFIRKLHSREATVDDIFIIAGPSSTGDALKATFRATVSLSTWPFYSLLAAMLLVVQRVVL